MWTSAKFPEPNMFPIVRSLRGMMLTMTKHDERWVYFYIPYEWIREREREILFTDGEDFHELGLNILKNLE